VADTARDHAHGLDHDIEQELPGARLREQQQSRSQRAATALVGCGGGAWLASAWRSGILDHSLWFGTLWPVLSDLQGSAGACGAVGRRRALSTTGMPRSAFLPAITQLVTHVKVDPLG